MPSRRGVVLAILMAAPMGGDGTQSSPPPEIAVLLREARERAPVEADHIVDQDQWATASLDIVVESLRREAERAPWTAARLEHERAVWGALAGEIIRVRHRDARWVRGAARTGYPDFVLELHGPGVGERLDPFRLAEMALRGRSQGLTFAVNIFSLDCHLE